MTAIENGEPAPAQEAERPSPQVESAWRVLAIAFGWIVLAMACSLAVGLVMGIAKVAFQLQDTPAFRLLLVTLGVSAFGAILIFAAVSRGRMVGGGDLRLGLSIAPIAKLPIIVGLAIALVAYGLLRDFALYKIRPDLFYQFSSVGPWLALFNAVVVVLLAPVAEEIFFRGWMWNGLRRQWDALPTALVTSAFWLILHIERGIAATAALIPIALILALAKQIGKSVRATIPLHAIYNLAVNLPLILIVIALFQNAPPTPQTPPASNSTIGTPTATVAKKDVFAGSESSIAAMNYVNTDCTSGAVPEVRVVTRPANGIVRLQTMAIPISRQQTDPLSRCNGKFVNAMGVYYKSNEGFTGSDTVVLDVDFRHGQVRRFIYNLTVR
jgi:membrane protease YdiL (CAAX protease family)